MVERAKLTCQALGSHTNFLMTMSFRPCDFLKSTPMPLSSSAVCRVRSSDTNSLTSSADAKGNPKSFANCLPVPRHSSSLANSMTFCVLAAGVCESS